jgi:nucleotide-binding universal stress UspA family protein
MFTNIMWATDGSENADRALEYATEIARAENAELHVAHVVEKTAGSRASGQNARLDEPTIEAKIESQTATVAQAGIKATLRRHVGPAAHIGKQLAQVAKDSGADLIVVGTRGHSPLAELMLGGVTQQLLHVAPCPVLAVPPAAAHRPEASPQDAVAAN